MDQGNSSNLAQLATRVPIKVYAKCLRSDIEYKTLSVGHETTSKEVIWLLLSKYRMKHRDPKLFYLTMDITIKRTGIPLKRSLSLDDDSRFVFMLTCFCLLPTTVCVELIWFLKIDPRPSTNLKSGSIILLMVSVRPYIRFVQNKSKQKS